MSETPITDSLAAKLARVTSKIETVSKTGTNTHFNYKFAPVSEIYKAARGLLADEGVSIMPTILSRETEEMAKSNVRTVLHMVMRISDGRETLELPWIAEGVDTQDKGVNKALTAAMKYFLIALLLIPTNEDSNATEMTSAPTGQSKHQRAQSSQRAQAQSAAAPGQWQTRGQAIKWGLEQVDPKTGAYAFAEAKQAVYAYDQLTRQYLDSLAPERCPTATSDADTRAKHQKAVFGHWQKLVAAILRGDEYILLPYQAPTKPYDGRFGAPLDPQDGASINDLRN